MWATQVNKLEPDKQNVKSPKKEVSLSTKKNTLYRSERDIFPSDTYYVMYEGFFMQSLLSGKAYRNIRLGYFFILKI